MSQLKAIFPGKVVNKRLTINTGVDEFPRYVVEYLIDNYCSEDNFAEDIQQVVKRLRENFVHGAETEKIRHTIRESRNHSIIASLEIRLQETEDKYWGTISAINETHVNVSESLVRQYPMLLSGGMWGTITLSYDETEVHGKKIRPFKVTEFTPFQVSMIDVNEFIDKRKEFGDEEWINVMVNSIGLNPELMTRRAKLLYMLRLIPLIESNFNCIELAPRETGKTYLYRNISYFTHVLSGGKATPASLFINNQSGKVGIVGSRDTVVFDEIANTDFTDPKALVSIMQGYMQDAKFSRGKKEILAHASIVLVGNLDVQNQLPHEKYYHLFEPLPSFLQVEAFIDRIHCYTPGWEIPKIRPDSMSQTYGFITDYFSEIMHDMRRVDLIGKVKHRYQLKDLSTGGGGITGRDVRAIEKTLSGLLKLLYPHGEINDEQLEEVLELALECRQRVRNQLHLMAPGEYGPIKLGAKLESGKEVAPTLPDANREQRVSLPNKPRVGEVTGLAVVGDDRGCLLHFEVQASKGGGRVVSLGSMQKVMKESVAAAAQFVKTHTGVLNLSNDWQDNQDVAVLATMMGIPKEGPSAGVTIVTGIVSALTRKQVRNDIAMTGEITIMGKVLGVGGILPKLQAAVDAGCKEVIVPSENKRDVDLIPDYIRDKVKVNYASTIEDVLNIALLDVKYSIPDPKQTPPPTSGGSESSESKDTPTPKTAEDLIGEGETTRVEFKSTLRVNMHTGDKDKKMELMVLKTVAAFLNTHGGHVIVGVNDQGEALGLENDGFSNEDKMNLHLVNILKDRIGAEHLVHTDIRFEDVGDKRVLVIQCSPSSLPVYHTDGKTELFFIRTGAATTELKPSEIQGYLKQRFNA